MVCAYFLHSCTGRKRMKRRIKIGQMVNLRDLGGYETADGRVTAWRKFYRSELPNHLSEEDKQRFHDLHLTTIIDLRSSEELAREQDELANEDWVEYWHCPASGEIIMPADDDIAKGYLGIALGKEHMREIFLHIMQAPQAVLFHCTAGKDRTGVTAALLLLLAGVDEKDIIADYALTYAYLKDKIDGLCKAYPDLPIHWLIPRAEYMEGFLERFAKRYPDIQDYFKELGFSDEEIAKLKEQLVQ